MIDMNTVMSFIHSMFQGGVSKLSKSDILAKVAQSNIAGALPFFKQLPEKNDYDENSLKQNMQNVMQKEGVGAGAGGGVAEKIKSKIGL